MVRTNPVSNEKHFEKFCEEMNKRLACHSPHCGKTSCASALRGVHKSCREGMGMGAAVDRWIKSRLTHKEGKEIFADLLGVEDLDTVTELLREDKNVGR